jgi:hypothetical protein
MPKLEIKRKLTLSRQEAADRLILNPWTS